MDFIGRSHLSITSESRKVNHAPRNSKCGRSAPPKLPAAFPWQICHRLSPEHPSDLLTQRLISVINDLGITFLVWEKTNADGKGSCLYD